MPSQTSPLVVVLACAGMLPLAARSKPATDPRADVQLVRVAAAGATEQPASTGSPMAWQADPNAGIDYSMGRTPSAATIVFRDG